MQDEHKTKVIFRKVPANYSGSESEVIALFPEIPGDMSPFSCLSYVHYGQHGAAMVSGHGWKLATKAEYADLKAELEAIGYNLDVKFRGCPAYFNARLKEIRKNYA